MRKEVFLFALVICAVSGSNGFGALQAQVAPGRFWVGFEDKVGSGFSLDAPTAFLSDRALDRRSRAGIAVDSLDLPVAAFHLDEVLAVDPSISLVHVSRWFNGGVFWLSDSASTDSLLGVIGDLTVVAEVRREAVIAGEKMPEEGRAFVGLGDENSSGSAPVYGASRGQIEMINLHFLHGLGYLGAGKRIAVLDAGYDNADELAPFDAGFDAGRIEPALDVVAGASGVWQYAHHGHGTMVLSTMTADSPGEMVGSGPAADYRLYRTEDVGSERLIEEFNWTVAAEHADSTGCDIINSSLGYSLFDDSLDHHVYQFMDGQTYRISLAAGLAATRGMLVVTSAGNSGDNPWHYITAPADAHGILAVGAVDGLREHANFSGYGPAADGRVKPEVCTQGRDATYLNPDGSIRQGNGTSFSSPILAGAAAALWSAHPTRSSAEIRGAIIASSDRFTSPDDAYGYGIPDFWEAHRLLGGAVDAGLGVVGLGGDDSGAGLWVYPNPSGGSVGSSSGSGGSSGGLLRVVYDIQGGGPAIGDLGWSLYDASGRRVLDGWVERAKSALVTFHIDVRGLAAGSYILEAHGGESAGSSAWARVMIGG